MACLKSGPPSVAGARYCRALASASVMRSGVAGCDERKSGAAGLMAPDLFRLELGIVLHRGEEAHGAVRIVTGARCDADADRVGFEFLRPRKARQRELGFGKRQRAGCRIADHIGDDAADEIGLPGLLLADFSVMRDHVPHFMRQDRGEFGIVVRQRDQSAGDVKLAGRQREGVDRLRIEHGDLVVQVRPLRRRNQALDHLLDHALQPRIVVHAAIGRKDALMLAQHRGRRRRPSACFAGAEIDVCGAPVGGDAVQDATANAAAAAAAKRSRRPSRSACQSQPSPSHHATQFSLAT